MSALAILRECGFAFADEVRQAAERNKAPRPPEPDYMGCRFVRTVRNGGEEARDDA